MKLLLDDNTGRAHGLNANEACVFAAILKCTKSGRGWFANYRDLAAALPFVISDETVRRAVNKLLTMEIIEKRENALFALPQNVVDAPQNVADLPQNVVSTPQNVTNLTPPNNPPIINNNMNEKEKEQPRALRTHDGEPQTPIPFYSGLKDSYKEKGGEWTNAIDCMAFEAWKKCTPVKKVKLVAAVKSGAHFKPRLDWLISDFPEPRPEVISADEYYKRYETTEELDGWRREYRPEERRSVYIKEP